MQGLPQQCKHTPSLEQPNELRQTYQWKTESGRLRFGIVLGCRLIMMLASASLASCTHSRTQMHVQCARSTVQQIADDAATTRQKKVQLSEGQFKYLFVQCREPRIPNPSTKLLASMLVGCATALQIVSIAAQHLPDYLVKRCLSLEFCFSSMPTLMSLEKLPLP